MSANLKRGCGILLIASVVLLSILALLPDADVDHDAGYTSSELSIRETVDGSVTSTSYVNPDGAITDAIDMGYATVCRMRDDSGRVVEERYLDANGDPVARYGNYYGLSYEYDETGTAITYLDTEGNPIIRSDGYSTIVFVIGGSLGHGEDVLTRADFKLSFSPMTFPHQLMRLILVEQIYRAFKIMKNETYHK